MGDKVSSASPVSASSGCHCASEVCEAIDKNGNHNGIAETIDLQKDHACFSALVEGKKTVAPQSAPVRNCAERDASILLRANSGIGGAVAGGLSVLMLSILLLPLSPVALTIVTIAGAVAGGVNGYTEPHCVSERYYNSN